MLLSGVLFSAVTAPSYKVTVEASPGPANFLLRSFQETPCWPTLSAIPTVRANRRNLLSSRQRLQPVMLFSQGWVANRALSRLHREVF